MSPFDPTTWPIPRLDWFFDGVRQYYSSFARENPEALPLVVWAGYFAMSWIAKKVPWVKTNGIPELVKGLFTGKWRGKIPLNPPLAKGEKSEGKAQP
jgi:hypothetical protein